MKMNMNYLKKWIDAHYEALATSEWYDDNFDAEELGTDTITPEFFIQTYIIPTIRSNIEYDFGIVLGEKAFEDGPQLEASVKTPMGTLRVDIEKRDVVGGLSDNAYISLIPSGEDCAIDLCSASVYEDHLRTRVFGAPSSEYPTYEKEIAKEKFDEALKDVPDEVE